MDVILLTDVEKVGLRGEVVNVSRGYMRNYPGPAPARRARDHGQGRGAREARVRARKARGAQLRAGARDRRDPSEDGASLRRERRAARNALRLGHRDGHRRRTVADAQDPRRSPQDRPRRLDQADRALRNPDRRLPGRANRGEDSGRARRGRASARRGAPGDGGRGARGGGGGQGAPSPRGKSGWRSSSRRSRRRPRRLASSSRKRLGAQVDAEGGTPDSGEVPAPPADGEPEDTERS